MKELLSLTKFKQTSNVLYSEEFYDNLMKFASFLSIMRNKRINPTILICTILDNKDLRDILILKSEVENFNLIMRYILEQFPNLVSSKLIRQKYKKYYKKYCM
jgi:hypothetical protein